MQLKRAGYSLRGIAEELGVRHSTIVRELRRNTRAGAHYHVRHADRLAKDRRKASKRTYRRIENNTVLARYIEERLHPLVSTKVVAHEFGLAHETIYAWIGRSRRDLLARLPQRGRRRRRACGCGGRLTHPFISFVFLIRTGGASAGFFIATSATM